ncbi:MAG: VOC family protein [Actinomycetota bacterium]
MTADLALVILAVGDLAASRDFYERAFGWRATVETPIYVEFMLASGMRVGIYEREGFGRNTGVVPEAIPDGALAPCELYLLVDDVDAALERVVAAGGRLLDAAAERSWGDVAAYAADPDGTVLALASVGRGAPGAG